MECSVPKLELKHEGAKLLEQDPKGWDCSTRYRMCRGTWTWNNWRASPKAHRMSRLTSTCCEFKTKSSTSKPAPAPHCSLLQLLLNAFTQLKISSSEQGHSRSPHPLKIHCISAWAVLNLKGHSTAAHTDLCRKLIFIYINIYPVLPQPAEPNAPLLLLSEATTTCTKAQS